MHRSIAATLLCLLLVPWPSPAQRAPLHVAAPLMMTAEGEAPVRLETASVRVDIGAGVARTTIDMTFRNPGRRVLEGNLQFPLRPGQQVAGFALDVDGHLREAVPVGKARGRQVFEEIAREGRDPGLLERSEGDFFRLRVYPFAAGGARRVRLVLLEPLARDARGASMTLPLQFARDLPAIDVAIAGAVRPELAGLLRPQALARGPDSLQRLHLQRGDYAPERGVDVRVAASAAPAVQVQRRDADTYFLAEVAVDAAAPAPRALPARVVVLWDSSMSGARRAHELEFALLDAYFRAAGDVDVQLVRLRDVAEAPQPFRVVAGDWTPLRDALRSTVYDGATAIGAWTPDPRAGDVLLFGDGLFNYGDAVFPAFAAGQRLFAIQAGTAGDGARLAALAAGRNGRAIELRDRADLADATAALLRATPRLVGLQAVGATDLVAESPSPDHGRLRIAGRLTEARARVRLQVDVNGRVAPVEVEIDLADAADGQLAAGQWARYTLAALQAEPQRNQAAIDVLGRRFGLVTSQTSLIVLENAQDYLRFDIAPPAELRAEVARLQTERDAERGRDRRSHLDAVADAWAARVAWWETPFPKTPPKRAPEQVRTESPADADALGGSPPLPMAAVAPAPAPPAAGESRARDDAGASGRELDRVMVTGSRISDADLAADDDAPAGEAPAANARIRLQPWLPDSPYARRLRAADARDVYAVYLDERARQSESTAFYLDVADVLVQKGQTALALRVLSNLAELDLDNRHVLRVLGYRLVEAGRADLAVPVFERVRAMSDEEPQSDRDLALALAATGERQRAIELLYEVVLGDWDDRFAEIDQTALAELNAIVATAPQPLRTDFVDPRLLRNLPLALRAVLSWDSNDSDMDLWVTDPNGEKAFYGHRLTYQGGRMSDDFTEGYGPEEFALRTAKPGKYRVEANLYGDQRQLVTGATTLQLWLSTGFGTARQHDRRVTLRLTDAKETVLVGEFEVE